MVSWERLICGSLLVVPGQLETALSQCQGKQPRALMLSLPEHRLGFSTLSTSVVQSRQFTQPPWAGFLIGGSAYPLGKWRNCTWCAEQTSICPLQTVWPTCCVAHCPGFAGVLFSSSVRWGNGGVQKIGNYLTFINGPRAEPTGQA